MKIIDTHTHLYLDDFDSDRDAMMQRALDAGVKYFLLPNIDSTSIDAMIHMESNYIHHAHALIGLHPCSVKENYKTELELVEKYLGDRSWIGIGEIGLDMYWDKTTIDKQLDAFTIQLQWARDAKIPVTIHTRECTSAAIDAVEKLQDGNIGGVFHCFGGSIDEANRIIAMGMYLGIGGVLTYKNSNLKSTIAAIDPMHIVVETDAPYLSPVPHRGKRNESSYLIYVMEVLSDVYKISLDEVSEIVYNNSLRAFPALHSI